jgi:hypothetical protein
LAADDLLLGSLLAAFTTPRAPRALEACRV